MFQKPFQQKVFISEMYDPCSKKNYRVQIHMSHPEAGITKGWVCVQAYISDFNPFHDIMVGIYNQAFSPGDIKSEEDVVQRIEDKVQTVLPAGAKLFNKIMSVCAE